MGSGAANGLSSSLSTSIIITSYNQRSTLELLLESLQRQTVLENGVTFEAIVADDGSSDKTEELCARREWGFPVQFVTQEDKGYRKSRILNQAIRVSRGDYLIFLDADVILERHFVEDHLSLRAADSFVCGRRVDLGPKFSAKISVDWIRAGRFDRTVDFGLLLSRVQKDTEHMKRALRVPFSSMRKVLGYDKPIDILGSNLSLWKKDLVEVNGFNEAMEAYWGEDGDLFIRLRNSGKKPIGAKGLCVQYHVFHRRREPSQENINRVSQLLKDREYRWAEKGLRT